MKIKITKNPDKYPECSIYVTEYTKNVLYFINSLGEKTRLVNNYRGLKFCKGINCDKDRVIPILKSIRELNFK